jgi:hypothetical protein
MVNEDSSSFHRAPPGVVRRVLLLVGIGALHAFALSGCLISATPVFGVDDSEDVAGGTGFWQMADKPDDTDFAMYVNKQKDGTYRIERRKEVQAAIAVHLHDNFYLLQTPGDEKKMGETYLSVAQVLPEYLVVYLFGPEKVDSIAKRLGIAVAKANIPGGDRQQIKALFMELSKSPEPEESQIVYSRIGSFTDKGREAIDAEADKKLADGDYAGALPALKFRADRGDRDAQLQLARIYLANLGNSFRAIEAAKQAYESGNLAAAALLAQIYWKGNSMQQAQLALPDYEKALEWAAMAWVDRVEPKQSQELMREIATQWCSTPALKANHADPLNCIYVYTKHYLDLANANHAVTKASQAVIAAHVEKLLEAEKSRARRNEIEKLDRKEQEVLGKLCAEFPEEKQCKRQPD